MRAVEEIVEWLPWFGLVAVVRSFRAARNFLAIAERRVFPLSFGGAEASELVPAVYSEQRGWEGK